MKALSIRQPWAWAILHAGKRVENRLWATSYRGPILIHAAKAWGRDERNARAWLTLCQETQEVPIDPALEIPDPPELGGIVGRAQLVGIVRRSADPWFQGPFGWVLEDIAPLPFRPCRGALKLFEVDI